MGIGDGGGSLVIGSFRDERYNLQLQAVDHNRLRLLDMDEMIYEPMYTYVLAAISPK